MPNHFKYELQKVCIQLPTVFVFQIGRVSPKPSGEAELRSVLQSAMANLRKKRETIQKEKQDKSQKRQEDLGESAQTDSEDEMQGKYIHSCYSAVTCKVLLNRPQSKLGQLCATRCSRLTRRPTFVSIYVTSFFSTMYYVT